MGQFGFRVPDELVAAFDAYAAPRGGRSKVIRELMQQALAREDMAPMAATPAPSKTNGNWEGILVRLTPAEYPALDAAAAQMGMSRGQWIAALVRRGLGSGRQFNPADRKRIASISQDLRKIEWRLGRAGDGLQEAARLGRPLDCALARLIEMEAEVVRLSHALHQAYLGNDAYWDDLSSSPDAAAPRKAASR